jgi:hypothetical protein
MSGAGWRQFAANEVLTSTNVQNYLQDQAVMRFASASARNSAITAPTQGMTAYLDDTGLTTQYFSAGTGGRASAGWYPLGVQLVKSIAIGSAVSSVTVTGAFSANFDSYRIVILGGVASQTTSLTVKLGSTTTGYYYGVTSAYYSTGGAITSNGANVGSWSGAGLAYTAGISADITLTSPFNADQTTIFAAQTPKNTTAAGGVFGGFLNDTNSYTDFTITTVAGTITGGTIYVYGWSK